MHQLILASNNAGKLREMRAILEPLGITVRSQREAGFDGEVAETGTTFAENAALKAHAVYDALHCAVVADDSGLLVDALDGAPGVYSHRFAGENATDAQRTEKLLEMLKDTPDAQRTARFECALCYLDGSGTERFFTGSCCGIIAREPRGENGFGYDPVFCCGNRTMAELSDEEKNQISHRANAFRKLEEYFRNRSKSC